jgi:hypothetical protein
VQVKQPVELLQLLRGAAAFHLLFFSQQRRTMVFPAENRANPMTFSLSCDRITDIYFFQVITR